MQENEEKTSGQTEWPCSVSYTHLDVYKRQAVDHAEKLIRDAKDQPILNAAIVSDVDIVLTGDKDFLSLDMEHPKCMTVAQFLESEGVEE